ncbi:hypothetical protein EX30DRAFT_68890 [Ascodesmis nigricans]|uniref:C2H2-type domain-containing protein n=1 Tax=Ascodesmis nigricans TaxID=341454 RepID=A0A4S2MU41_9PEZI|nr:hypothetical protein EX30DRAFT_68890 [Ascodesmis nigricans]
MERYNTNIEAPTQPPQRDRSRSSHERDMGGTPAGESTFGRLNAPANTTNNEPEFYGGRGRGRSPLPGRRRRSRSPGSMGGNIDRYVPGGSPSGRRRSRSPQRGPYDTPGRYAPHQQGQNSGGRIDRYVPGGMIPGIGPGGIMVPSLSSMPDPHKLDHSVTYTYFSDWYHQEHGKTRPGETITKDEVQVAFDRYKEELSGRLARIFVAAHKNDEWFKERYLPGEKEISKGKVNAFRREQWRKWRYLLEHGAFDNVDRETKVQSQRGDADGADVVEEINRGVDDGGLRPVLLIKTISPTVSRKQLEELATSNLTNFHFISLSDPNPLKKFHRIGFILLQPQDPDDPTSEPAPVDESTVELLNGKSIHDETHGDFTCHVGIHNGPTNPKARKLLNEWMSMPANLRKEANFIERCARKLEAEIRVDDSMEDYEGWEAIKEKVESWGSGERERRQTTEEEGEEGAESEVELTILKKKIDIGVEYLRRAFNFCMYCVSCSDSIHELTRKCPGGHIRRPTPSPDYTADARTINWTKTWQEKLELFVNPPDPDSDDYEERLRKVGGKPVRVYVEDEIQKCVKQEDEGKYRCRVGTCTKLFKGEEFWRKHLDKKHSDWLDQIRADATLVNAYVCDPTRVHPPKVEQHAHGQFNSGGRGGYSNGQAMGYPPPGFNMTSGLPFNPGGFMGSANGNGIMSNPALPGNRGIGPIRHRDARQQPPNQLNPNGRGGPGPGRYNQAPYIPRDRAEREKERERRDREMREAEARKAGGVIVPPGLMPLLGNPGAPVGAGIPGLGGPVPGAGGPEADLAVMGRAVKSYKDLDATGAGKGTDELDY